MPEGDTIWRMARTLHGVLADQQVTGFHSPLAEIAAVAQRFPLAGRKVESVESQGKQLQIRISGSPQASSYRPLT